MNLKRIEKIPYNLWDLRLNRDMLGLCDCFFQRTRVYEAYGRWTLALTWSILLFGCSGREIRDMMCEGPDAFAENLTTDRWMNRKKRTQSFNWPFRCSDGREFTSVIFNRSGGEVGRDRMMFDMPTKLRIHPSQLLQCFHTTSITRSLRDAFTNVA